MPNPNYIFANTINGHPLYADRAEHDADGNLISTTYATKAELPEGVPTVTSSDDGKVLQASYSGGTGSVSWVTPAAGGNGIDSVVEPMLKTTPDGKTVTGALGCSFVYSQGSGNIPLINGYGNSHRFYIGDPWHQEWISSTGAKTINICSATASIGTQVAWVPADTTWTSGKPARYLLDKTASFQDGPIGSPYYIWRSTGAEQVANFYRIITVNVPTSATGPFDTAIFDVVGDWSNITTPISEWTIGFTTDSGVTFTGIDGRPTTASTNVSMQLHKVYEVKRADSSLSLNSLTGLYVTNPLPSSTSSDEDKVLTVNSSGTPVWATPSSGGGINPDSSHPQYILHSTSQGALEWTYPAWIGIPHYDLVDMQSITTTYSNNVATVSGFSCLWPGNYSGVPNPGGLQLHVACPCAEHAGGTVHVKVAFNYDRYTDGGATVLHDAIYAERDIYNVWWSFDTDLEVPLVNPSSGYPYQASANWVNSDDIYQPFTSLTITLTDSSGNAVNFDSNPYRVAMWIRNR